MNKLSIPIFGGYIELYDSVEKIKKLYPQHDFEIWGAGFTASIVDEGCNTIVIYIERKDVNTITHESIHAAYDILHFSGIPINHENSEVVCYLSGWIAEQLFIYYKGEKIEN